MRYPNNYGVLQLEQVHLNSELLGTLCDKRHDAVVVMHFHLFLARENTTPTRAITVILYANLCICLQIAWVTWHAVTKPHY